MSDLRPVRFALRGMDEASDEPGDASLIQNMVWDERGVWRTMPGAVQVGTEPTGEVLAMAWFHRGQATRKLLIEEAVDESTSRLVVLQLPAGTVRVVQADRPRGRAAAVMVPAGDWLLILGEDAEPVMWDGVVLRPAGFSKPPAPPIANPYDGVDTMNGTRTAAGSGYYATGRQRGVGGLSDTQDTPWSRAYCLTVLNEAGQESPPSAVVVASGENAKPAALSYVIPGVAAASWPEEGLSIVRVELPPQAETAFGVRLYASSDLREVEVVSPVMYLHTEISHAGGCVIADYLRDGQLGPFELDRNALGYWPAGATIAAEWGNRLWLAGMPDQPNRVRYSELGLLEQTPEVNYLEAAIEGGGPVRGFVATRRVLVVLCEGATFMVQDPGSPRITLVSPVYGCPGPRCAAEVPGLGVVGMSKSGPFLIRGVLDEVSVTEVVPLRGLRKLWRQRVNHEALEVAAVSVNPAYQEVWFQVPEAGDRRPTLGLVLHYGDQRGWSTREEWPVSAFARSGQELWVGSWNASQSGVWVVSEGYAQVAGATVQGLYRTGWVVTTESEVVVDNVAVHGVAIGAQAMGLRHRIRAAWADEGSRAQAPHWEDLPAWGSAVWSTTETYSERLDELHHYPVDSDRSHRFMLELSGANAQAREVELHLLPGEGVDF